MECSISLDDSYIVACTNTEAIAGLPVNAVGLSFNTTLNDELNRLANGGTYRLMSEMVDMALAAQQWATAVMN